MLIINGLTEIIINNDISNLNINKMVKIGDDNGFYYMELKIQDNNKIEINLYRYIDKIYTLKTEFYKNEIKYEKTIIEDRTYKLDTQENKEIFLKIIKSLFKEN